MIDITIYHKPVCATSCNTLALMEVGGVSQPLNAVKQRTL